MTRIFVSAFLTNINDSSNNVEKYVVFGQLFCRMAVPKIIFLEKSFYDLYEFHLLENEWTHIVLMEKKELYLFREEWNLKEFHIETDNPGKDTLQYLFTQCSKTEWIRKAIEISGVEEFIWVDFGLFHIFRGDVDSFRSHLFSVIESPKKNEKKIRIGGCWDLQLCYNVDIYKRVAWYFCGGVFGGSRDALLHFADKMKKLCIEMMTEKKTLLWEVNLWYFLYREEPELFDVYRCGHDPSILANY